MAVTVVRKARMLKIDTEIVDKFEYVCNCAWVLNDAVLSLGSKEELPGQSFHSVSQITCNCEAPCYQTDYTTSMPTSEEEAGNKSSATIWVGRELTDSTLLMRQ